MTPIPNLTFVVFTFNEEARLPNVIRNIQPYGRILVVDNYSTDKTVAIARENGCDVLLNQNRGWVEDEETTAKVKAAAQTDWLFWAFADEFVPHEVLEIVNRIIVADSHDVVQVTRKNYLYGEFCYDVAASYQTKAFKKDAIDFSGNTIHNFGRITSPPERVYKIESAHFVHHLISNTAGSYLNSINRYTDLETATKASQDLRRSIPYLLILPIKILWCDWLLKGGRKAGRIAIHLSALMLIYLLINALKGEEASRQIDSNEISQRNRSLMEKLLQEAEAMGKGSSKS